MPREFEPLCQKARRVIIDTDIGPDCDDAGAIAILCLASRRLGFEIAAAVNCTSNPFGDGAIDALVRFAGVDGVRIGRWMGSEFLSEHRKYNEPVAMEYSEAFRCGFLSVKSSIDMYREVFSSSEDDGVVVVTVGQMNALAEVLAAEPELCKSKIHGIVSMAGSCDESVAEYNIVCDAPAADSVFVLTEKLGIPVILSPFELSVSVMTGFAGDDGGRDPLRDSYRYYTDGRMRRNSWDLTAVQFAVEGCGRYYGLSEYCKIRVREDGTMGKSCAPDGNVRFMEKKRADRELELYLDGLLASARG